MEGNSCARSVSILSVGKMHRTCAEYQKDTASLKEMNSFFITVSCSQGYMVNSQGYCDGRFVSCVSSGVCLGLFVYIFFFNQGAYCCVLLLFPLKRCDIHQEIK